MLSLKSDLLTGTNLWRRVRAEPEDQGKKKKQKEENPRSYQPDPVSHEPVFGCFLLRCGICLIFFVLFGFLSLLTLFFFLLVLSLLFLFLFVLLLFVLFLFCL